MLLLLKAKITNDVLFNAMAGLETSSDDESDAELVAVTPANKSSSKRGSSAAKSCGSSSSSSGKKPKRNPKPKTRIYEEDFETVMRLATSKMPVPVTVHKLLLPPRPLFLQKTSNV